ncbi:hypothetical protein BACCAP_04009 [Pseudoflavonifractor capillosus ATCC 29799]|uniref:Uncharacterized protein n=1 Tax=Pseudoflavonifractor capillosus ATCC 29799 TaxID=411467 RepID=A6P0J8_9FIRM|nr:hypothetical protein BACCAP_04009 [Pseudoflavonifractor capillosus ATCC 29799]
MGEKQQRTLKTWPYIGKCAGIEQKEMVFFLEIRGRFRYTTSVERKGTAE